MLIYHRSHTSILVSRSVLVRQVISSSLQLYTFHFILESSSHSVVAVHNGSSNFESRLRSFSSDLPYHTLLSRQKSWHLRLPKSSATMSMQLQVHNSRFELLSSQIRSACNPLVVTKWYNSNCSSSEFNTAPYNTLFLGIYSSLKVYSSIHHNSSLPTQWSTIPDINLIDWK